MLVPVPAPRVSCVQGEGLGARGSRLSGASAELRPLTPCNHWHPAGIGDGSAQVGCAQQELDAELPVGAGLHLLSGWHRAAAAPRLPLEPLWRRPAPSERGARAAPLLAGTACSPPPPPAARRL